MLYIIQTPYAGNEYAALPADMSSQMSAVSGFISLDFRDIEIRDALKFLAAKANMNIVPTSAVSGRITLMIENVPVDDIFELVIRSNGLAYEKIGGIYNVMTKKEYKERYGKSFDDIRQVRIFHLNYVIPEQAFKIIDSMKSSIGKVLVDSDSGTLMVLDTPDKIEEVSTTLDSLERKSSIKVFTLRYAQAEEIAKQLKTQLDMKKVGSVRADKRTNQLIIQTLPDRMNDIEKIITELDQKTKQILIDARIIQINLKDNFSEGVQWEGLFNISTGSDTKYLGSYPPSFIDAVARDWKSRKQAIADIGYVGAYPFSGTTTNFSASTPKVITDQMHVGVVGKDDYDVVIDYLKTIGEVRILSNPKLAVINNQEAKIHVGERQAYITSTTTAGTTSTTVAEQVTFMDVGLQLFITPTINDKGYVTLNIKPDLSSVIGTLTTAQNNAIPIIDTSTAETTVMVKDGMTVVVAGLRRDDNTINSRRVPILSKVPFVGKLFSSEEKKKSRSELLIMITAHIISGEELTTGRERDFGYTTGKEEYRKYDVITTESDLTDYKNKNVIIEKTYQDYPEYEDKAQEYQPEIKPLKDE